MALRKLGWVDFPIQTAWQKKHRSHGFTLVEIMVVTVILAILASWLVPLAKPLWQPLPGHELKRAQQLLKSLQQRAVYSHKPYAAQFWQGGIEFCELKEGTWQPIKENPWSQFLWKGGYDMTLVVDGQPLSIQETPSCKLDILMEPDGLMTVFSVTLSHHKTATLLVDEDNQLVIAP